MNLTLLASGSRGDVQPYVALGVGLKQAGHAVRLAAPADFAALAEAHGLPFAPLVGGVEAAARSMQALLDRGRMLPILTRMRELALANAREGAGRGRAACAGADLIVAGLGSLFTAVSLSEALNIPLVQAHLMPLHPTRAFPGVLAAVPRWAGFLNAASHRLTRQALWQMGRAADNAARAEVLGLPPAPFAGPWASLKRRSRAVLYGISRHVVPKPSDWPAAVEVTGYWPLNPEPGWLPPADLVAFLAAGPPPVYVGFGSMISGDPAAAAALVVEALKRAGRRGVLAAGWGGLEADQAPEGVFLAGAVPHGWLFERAAAVVHHGGAGTTAAGLRAGVPSVVVPFFGDQPFWGRRVHELGAGPAPVPRRRLTVENLTEAIRRATSDGPMRAAAARLGEQIRGEDGVGAAVAAIERSAGVARRTSVH